MDTYKGINQMENELLFYAPRTIQAINNDTGMAEAIDEYNFQENLKALENFNPDRSITFHTRGGDLVIDKSAKSGLMRTTPEGAPFPTDTKIPFDKFQKTVEQDPKQIALFFAQQNLFEPNGDKNSMDELKTENTDMKKEEL